MKLLWYLEKRQNWQHCDMISSTLFARADTLCHLLVACGQCVVISIETLTTFKDMKLRFHVQ